MQAKKAGKKGRGKNTGEEIQPPKEWTSEEEQALRDAHDSFGNSWSLILKSERFKAVFAGRVEYMLSNKWKSMMVKDAMEKAVTNVSEYNMMNLVKEVNCTLSNIVIGVTSANQKLGTILQMLRK